MGFTRETNADIDRALDAARVKKVVATLLSGLDRATARSVLADLFVEFAGADEAPSRTEGSQSASGGTRRGGAHGVRNRGARVHGGKTEALLEALRAKPHRPISEYAEIVYGEGSAETQKKVRSLLAALKRAKPSRATNPIPGQWEAVD
jgi:hypothetical protein